MSVHDSPSGRDDESSHGSPQNVTMPQPTQPIHEIVDASESSQAQDTNRVALSRDPVHGSMLIQLANTAFRMNTLHIDFNASTLSGADMNAFHEEFNAFVSEMSRMILDSNARLLKTQSERDELLEELSKQQLHMEQQKQKLKQLELQLEQRRQQEQQVQQENQHLPNATMPDPSTVIGAVGSNKSKSEKMNARKALTIKVPTGYPSTFARGSSSSGRMPMSAFEAGPSSGMTPLTPFIATPSTPFVTTPSSPSDMIPRASFMTGPLSNGLQTPKNSMIPPLRDLESPTGRYVAVPSSSIMESSTFGNLPGPSGLSPEKTPLGASSSSAMANTKSFIRGPPPMNSNMIYRAPHPVDLSPLTPDRIGPSTVTSNQRTLNSVLRRKFNSLVNIMPPSTVFIPEVPLTDTEIIVYFFQSLSRPEVALRLYSRRWGPQTITDTFNKHRHIEGGYVPNTTSVRCTTSIKRGKEKYGDNWYDEKRDLFAHANDWMATQLIRQTGEEREQATDFEISRLDRQLKQHPAEGLDGGIFTQCVKWCCARKDTSTYTLKNVHQLVLVLKKWGDDLDELNEIFTNQDAQQVDAQQVMAQGVDGANNTMGLDANKTTGLENIDANNALSLKETGANNTLSLGNFDPNATFDLENFDPNNPLGLEDFNFDNMVNFDIEGVGDYTEPSYTGKGKEPAK